MVSGLLVAQISRRNGGMLFNALTRSRRLGLLRLASGGEVGAAGGGAGIGR